MKPEARVLVSKCYGGLCLGIVVRLDDVDGAAAGCGCEGLCESLEDKGYMGELRYAIGDCRCGLPLPPRDPGALALSLLATLSSDYPLWVEKSRALGVLEDKCARSGGVGG